MENILSFWASSMVFTGPILFTAVTVLNIKKTPDTELKSIIKHTLPDSLYMTAMPGVNIVFCSFAILYLITIALGVEK